MVRPPLTEAQLAQMAQALLQRARLDGSEVETYTHVWNWLETKKAPTPVDDEVEQAS